MSFFRLHRVSAVVLAVSCMNTILATPGKAEDDAVAKKKLADQRQAETSWMSTLKVSPDVVYGHKDGLALTLDVYQPREGANGAGVIALISGGWFSRWSSPEKMLRLAEPLTDKGFTVFAVRHGSSPRYTMPEIVEDVRRSVRYVRLHAEKYGVDPNRLGVQGGSAGGHLSLLLGTASDEGNADSDDPVLQVSDRVQAVVAWVPPTDLRIMSWQTAESLPVYKNFPALDLSIEEAAKYSPLVHVTPDDSPTLILSGAKDEIVPIRHSEEIHDAFEGQHVPNRLIIFEDSGHGFQQKDQQKAMRAMDLWFEKHLLKSQHGE